MDLMRIVQSLEQFLFEVVVWLVFFPRTMALAIVRPLKTMAYADDEMDDADEDRYSDTINPPLFLILTLALGQALQGFGSQPSSLGFLRSPENALAVNILLFSLLPLAFSLRLLRAKGVALDRRTLRPPFYQQCYVSAPFALVMTIGEDVAHLHLPAGGTIASALIVMAIGWYLAVQSAWFALQLGQSRLRALANVLQALGTALLFFILGIVILGIMMLKEVQVS